MEHVQERNLAIFLPQSNPEGVNEFENSRVQEDMTDIDVLQRLRTSIVLVDRLFPSMIVRWRVVR